MNAEMKQNRSPSRHSAKAHEEDAREAALSILENHWAKQDGIINFPVDPVAIARRVGLEVLISELKDDISGILIKRAETDTPRIYLNSKAEEQKQRYTCAHQLGRYIHNGQALAEKNSFAFVDQTSVHKKVPERTSDLWPSQFASELLMPAAAVRTLWAQGQSMPRIAKVLGVTQATARIRVANLGLS